MGSSVTSTIVNTTPMFSTVLAILILEERPAPLVVLGVALTVGGLVTVSWGGEKTSYKKSELIYPFLCALLFSMKDVAVRWGLGGGGGQPILAAGIAALTSTIEIFLITRYLQGEQFVLPPAPVARWFMGSGIFTGASFLFMYLAYSLERVSIVAPLVNSYTVFVSILTPFMMPQEAFAALVEQLVSQKSIDEAASKKLPLTAYFDNRFVIELEKEGFFKKLWQ